MDAVDNATPGDVKEFRETIRKYEDLLEVWLAGPESNGETFSDEYIAFAAMLMAYDGC